MDIITKIWSNKNRVIFFIAVFVIGVIVVHELFRINHIKDFEGLEGNYYIAQYHAVNINKDPIIQIEEDDYYFGLYEAVNYGRFAFLDEDLSEGITMLAVFTDNPDYFPQLKVYCGTTEIFPEIRKENNYDWVYSVYPKDVTCPNKVLTYEFEDHVITHNYKDDIDLIPEENIVKMSYPFSFIEWAQIILAPIGLAWIVTYLIIDLPTKFRQKIMKKVS